MQVENRLFDDFTRLANGALGSLTGLRNEIEALVRQRFERMLADMDLVNREEFEAVKAVAANARAEQEALAARVAELEKALAEMGAARGDFGGPSGKPKRRKSAPPSGD